MRHTLYSFRGFTKIYHTGLEGKTKFIVKLMLAFKINYQPLPVSLRMLLNTEPLVRLNVESGSNAEALQAHVSAIADALGGARA